MASRTIDLGARVEDLTRVVSESRKVDTVFLGGNCFAEFSFFDVVGVNALVITRGDEVIALVIKVQGGHVFRRFLLAREKPLIQRAVSLHIVTL